MLFACVAQAAPNAGGDYGRGGHDAEIVIFPDTQSYPPHDGTTTWGSNREELFTSMLDYAQDNAGLVIHVGDFGNDYCTSDGELQWQTGWGVLEQRLTRPFYMARGNHDCIAQFVEHYGPTYFQGKSHWRNSSPTGLSQAGVVTLGGRRFLAMALDCSIPASELAWAVDTMGRYPGLPTIVTSHAIAQSSDGDVTDATGLASPGTGYACTNVGNLKTNFVNRYPDRIVMTFGGHWYNYMRGRYQSDRDASQPSWAAIVNYQAFNGPGDGWLYRLRFNAETGKGIAEPVNPYRGLAGANDGPIADLRKEEFDLLLADRFGPLGPGERWRTAAQTDRRIGGWYESAGCKFATALSRAYGASAAPSDCRDHTSGLPGGYFNSKSGSYFITTSKTLVGYEGSTTPVPPGSPDDAVHAATPSAISAMYSTGATTWLDIDDGETLWVSWWWRPRWSMSGLDPTHFLFNLVANTGMRVVRDYYSGSPRVRFTFGTTTLTQEWTGFAYDEWHHVALRIRRTGTAYAARVVVNGAALGAEESLAAGYTPGSASTIAVGAGNEGTATYWSELVAFETTLTEDEEIARWLGACGPGNEADSAAREALRSGLSGTKLGPNGETSCYQQIDPATWVAP